jgi:rhamnose transport system permease protein
MSLAGGTATPAPGPDQQSQDAGPRSQQLVDLVIRVREFGIVAVLVAFVAVTTAVQPRFLNDQNIKFILSDTTIYALLAVGQTMVVVSRNVDLSVGSVLGLSAFLSSDMFSQFHGVPIFVVFVAGLVIGLACGAFNGAIVAIAGVPSLVVTLATLYIIRGIDVVVVGGNMVVASTLPDSFIAITTTSVFGVPVLFIVIAAVVAGAAYYLHSFRSGRELYAIGSNPDAARLAGIPTGRRVFTAFVVSGGIVWSAEVLLALPASSGRPPTGLLTQQPALVTSFRSWPESSSAALPYSVGAGRSLGPP